MILRRCTWRWAVAGLAASFVVVTTPSSSVGASCTISTTLRQGSSGVAVTCLEQRLQALGLQASYVDTYFGTVTTTAVKAFQRSNGLTQDGVVGPITGARLGIWSTTNPPSNTCLVPASVPADALAVVDVKATGSYATLVLKTRATTSEAWLCHRPMSARVGRNGIIPLAQRVADTGTTPAGTFPLGTTTAPNGDVFSFFGNGTNPGVQGGWHSVRANDCWSLTPGVASYNTLISASSTACPAPSEYLPRYTNAYIAAALIGANLGPDRSGDQAGEVPRAGAIFLHRHSYDANGRSKPTSGCVSLTLTDLRYVLTRLPAATYFVIS